MYNIKIDIKKLPGCFYLSFPLCKPLVGTGVELIQFNLVIPGNRPMTSQNECLYS